MDFYINRLHLECYFVALYQVVCNVISLECNNTDVAEYDKLLSAY